MLNCCNGNKYNSGKSTSYGKNIKGNGSIIVMSLNLLNKTLSFNIDNIDYGIAFHNLPHNKYRFAVDMGDANDEIIISERIEKGTEIIINKLKQMEIEIKKSNEILIQNQ